MKRKERIFENLQWLLKNGYEIRLTENSIIVLETYKSESRNKYLEKKVFDSWGSLKYFDEKCLHVTENKFIKLKQELKTNLPK